jgi:hypothetical protein
MKKYKIYEEKLKEFDPKLLLENNEVNEITTFFLILGLIYNDLKSLYFHIIQMNNYFADKEIDEEEPTSILGHRNDFRGHMDRLFFSTIHEFFHFLQKHSSIRENKDFQKILSKLKEEEQKIWQDFFQVAINGALLNQKGRSLKNLLIKIRNNGGFHYYQIDKGMSQGYLNCFIQRKYPHKVNKLCYWSKGDNMSNTQYFFASASMQSMTLRFYEELDIEQKDILNVLKYIPINIMHLMNEFIDYKSNEL